MRIFFAHAFDRFRPEKLCRYAPGTLKDVRQNEHRHVAAHSVTLAGDFHQLAGHRFLRGRVAIVELKSVRPARKVRIAPVGKNQVALFALYPGIVLRRSRQVQFGSGDEIVGVILDPGVIRGHVVWDKIEQQLQSAFLQPLSQTGERRVATEIAMDDVVG